MLEPYCISRTSKVGATATGFQCSGDRVFLVLIIKLDCVMQEPTCTGMGGMENSQVFQGLDHRFDG